MSEFDTISVPAALCPEHRAGGMIPHVGCANCAGTLKVLADALSKLAYEYRIEAQNMDRRAGLIVVNDEGGEITYV